MQFSGTRNKMASSHVIESRRSFLPTGHLRPRVTRDSVVSSSSSGESSRYSIRSGSYPARYASHISQDSRVPPPIPPLRLAAAVPNLPPIQSTRTQSSMVSATQAPGDLASPKSNYQRIRSKGCLLQRRYMAVFSTLALCVSMSVALLLGYKGYGHLQTRTLVTDWTASHNKTCVDGQENSTFHARDKGQENLDVKSFQQQKYTDEPMEKHMFRQAHFETQEINTPCKNQVTQLNITHAGRPPGSGIDTSQGTGLRISKRGWYFVYSSLLYRITRQPHVTYEVLSSAPLTTVYVLSTSSVLFGTDDVDVSSKPWKHQINKIRVEDNRHKRDILSIASYNCNGECLNTNRSSYTAGLFYLCSDDVVMVNACGAMYVYGHEESSYLGLFMTSEFPEESC